MSKNRNAVRSTKIDRIFDVINVTILLLVCLVLVYPLYYVLIASFTDPTIVNTGKLLLFPKPFYANGYEKIFDYPPIWSAYWNTIKYTVVGTLFSLITTIPCAYSLSRKDMYGQRFLMFLFTFTMFFQGGIIPLFLLINNIHIYDTIWAIVLPTAVSVWNLIICRSFFESNIPAEMLEAARIDGCTDFGFFFKIVMPLSTTIITVMILFYSTTMWNSFMNPLMFLQNTDKMPLQVILRNLVLSNQVATMGGADAMEAMERQKLAEQLKYGVIVVSALPLLCIYPFLQRYFIKGVMVGAVKG